MQILYILVIYNQNWKESVTYQTLIAALAATQSTDYQLLIYDNSPLKQNTLAPKKTTYYHDVDNNGIQGAYQYGYEYAQKNDLHWLCFLDQDTIITHEYIQKILTKTWEYQSDSQIVALVPFVESKQTLISPTYAGTVRPLRQSEQPQPGLSQKPVTAISSATCLKVGFIHEINGLHSPFSLDYFDHWLFWMINDRNKKVFILNTLLQHDLSVLHYQDLSLARYQSILSSENLFYQNYEKSLYGSFQRHLFFRFCKQLLTVKNKKIAFTTFKQWRKNFSSNTKNR